MSWIAIVGQVVHFSFFPTYCDIKTFEQSGQVYERVGIRFFKKLVRRGPLAIFSPTLEFPVERTVSALRNLESEMRHAETGHALIFVFMLLFVGYALLNGWLDAVVWILLFNICSGPIKLDSGESAYNTQRGALPCPSTVPLRRIQSPSRSGDSEWCQDHR